MEYPMVDATIVKVHRQSQGAKRGLRARPGHRFDTVGITPLIAGVEFGGLAADKGSTAMPASPT